VTADKRTTDKDASPGRSADDILATPPKPTLHIVQGLITEGFTLISGPAKSKKSYLMTDIASSVALGIPCLENRYQTLQGAVLFLDYEDDETGQHLRLKNLFPEVPNFQDLLRFEQDAGVGNDAHQYIHRWVLSTRSAGLTPRLVVIDTISDFRAPLSNKGGSQYDQEKAFAKRLNVYGLTNHIGIVGLHHNNQGRDHADPSHKMSGTEGLLAGTFGYIIVDRGGESDENATLFMRHRRLGSSYRTATFKNWRWNIGDTVSKTRERGDQQAIIAFLDDNPKDTFTTAQIATMAGLKSSKANIWKMLSRLSAEDPQKGIKPQIKKHRKDCYQSLSGCQVATNPDANPSEAPRENPPDTDLTPPDMSGATVGFESDPPDCQVLSGEMSGGKIVEPQAGTNPPDNLTRFRPPPNEHANGSGGRKAMRDKIKLVRSIESRNKRLSLTVAGNLTTASGLANAKTLKITSWPTEEGVGLFIEDAAGVFRWANPSKKTQHIRISIQRFNELLGYEFPDFTEITLDRFHIHPEGGISIIIPGPAPRLAQFTHEPQTDREHSHTEPHHVH
jgi:AAA domain